MSAANKRIVWLVQVETEVHSNEVVGIYARKADAMRVATKIARRNQSSDLERKETRLELGVRVECYDPDVSFDLNVTPKWVH